MASTPLKQENVVANYARHLIFFEDSGFAYNYKTGRWTDIDALTPDSNADIYSWYTVNSATSVVGLVRTSSGSIDLQVANSSDEAQTATLETAEVPLKAFKRSLVQGVRGFINEATGTSVSVEIGTRNDQSTTVSYSTLSSINSQTKMYNGRVEGRYHRAKFTITGGFDSAIGGEVHFTPQGEK